MKFTDITISLRDEDKLKAFVNVTFDDRLVVRGFKVIKGDTGYFVSMPSRKMNDGIYRDIAHPVSDEFRAILEAAILEKYVQELKLQGTVEKIDISANRIEKFYDVFISHASEDKTEIAKPLASYLKKRGLKIWLDDFELTIGDSISKSIDRGLAESRFGVVILSPSFFKKKWPKRELEGLLAREDEKSNVILPVWHNVKFEEVVKFSPILADKLAVQTTNGINFIAKKILRAVKQHE